MCVRDSQRSRDPGKRCVRQKEVSSPFSLINIDNLVVKSAVLNFLCLVSVVAFNWSISPLLDPTGNGWWHRNFEAIYQGLWLSPLVAVSLFLNVSKLNLVRVQNDQH